MEARGVCSNLTGAGKEKRVGQRKYRFRLRLYEVFKRWSKIVCESGVGDLNVDTERMCCGNHLVGVSLCIGIARVGQNADALCGRHCFVQQLQKFGCEWV